MLPWRRKIEAWMRERYADRDIRAIIYKFSLIERRMDDMDEKMDAVVKKAEEVSAYVSSVVDQVKTALDYLRNHSDAGVAAAAEKVSDSLDAIAKKMSELGASGGVSE